MKEPGNKKVTRRTVLKTTGAAAGGLLLAGAASTPAAALDFCGENVSGDLSLGDSDSYSFKRSGFKVASATIQLTDSTVDRENDRVTLTLTGPGGTSDSVTVGGSTHLDVDDTATMTTELPEPGEYTYTVTAEAVTPLLIGTAGYALETNCKTGTKEGR